MDDRREGSPRAVSQNPGGRLHITTSSPPGAEVIHRVADESVNQAVADKLWRLHWDHGYFTRAEIEAALGLDPPRGEWVCPGQFGADGRWSPCCWKEPAA